MVEERVVAEVTTDEMTVVEVPVVSTPQDSVALVQTPEVVPADAVPVQAVVVAEPVLAVALLTAPLETLLAFCALADELAAVVGLVKALALEVVEAVLLLCLGVKPDGFQVEAVELDAAELVAPVLRGAEWALDAVETCETVELVLAAALVQ